MVTHTLINRVSRASRCRLRKRPTRLSTQARSTSQGDRSSRRTDRTDTSYGKIIEAVEKAERSRAPVQRLAERMAGYLVYFAIGAAALTFLITGDVRSTISVVIVAGACGIAVGTPLAILGGIGRSARLGAIIKGGLYLETLGRVDTIVLDKTGTLTFGRPEVQTVTPAEGVSPDAVLDAAAAAESRSEHPLGQAIVSYAHAKGRNISEPERFDYTPGRGIAAAVDGVEVLVGNRPLMIERGITLPTNLTRKVEAVSEIFVARDGRFLGEIVVADTVRPEAKRAVEALRRMRMRIILLTGDTKAVGAAVGIASGSTSSRQTFFQRTNFGASRTSCPVVGSLPWSATALTTPLRLPRQMLA